MWKSSIYAESFLFSMGIWVFLLIATSHADVAALPKSSIDNLAQSSMTLCDIWIKTRIPMWNGQDLA